MAELAGSRGDQFFTEAQTESYRLLGLHSIRDVARHWSGDSFTDFCTHFDAAPAPP